MRGRLGELPSVPAALQVRLVSGGGHRGWQTVGWYVWLVVRVLREKGLGPLLIVSDCKGVVDDFKRGELYYVSHVSKYAHLWREFWHHVNDMGLDSFEMKWAAAGGGARGFLVPSHRQ